MAELALPFAALSLGRLLGIADDEAIRLGRLTRQVSGAFDQFATAAQHARTAAAGGEHTTLLLRHPDQATLLRRRPELAPRAVAEILRYEPPVQLVARAAHKPAELGGRLLPEGSLVFGLIAAGNRDPLQITTPEVFNLTREQGPSLSFGAGPHYCLGAHLTGTQGEILFPRLLRRFPGLRLAGDPVYRTPGSTLRGLDHLPIALS